MYAVYSVWLVLVLYIDYFMFNSFYLSIRSIYKWVQNKVIDDVTAAN